MTNLASVSDSRLEESQTMLPFQEVVQRRIIDTAGIPEEEYPSAADISLPFAEPGFEAGRNGKPSANFRRLTSRGKCAARFGPTELTYHRCCALGVNAKQVDTPIYQSSSGGGSHERRSLKGRATTNFTEDIVTVKPKMILFEKARPQPRTLHDCSFDEMILHVVHTNMENLPDRQMRIPFET